MTLLALVARKTVRRGKMIERLPLLWCTAKHGSSCSSRRYKNSALLVISQKEIHPQCTNEPRPPVSLQVPVTFRILSSGHLAFHAILKSSIPRGRYCGRVITKAGTSFVSWNFFSFPHLALTKLEFTLPDSVALVAFINDASGLPRAGKTGFEVA